MVAYMQFSVLDPHEALGMQSGAIVLHGCIHGYQFLGNTLYASCHRKAIWVYLCRQLDWLARKQRSVGLLIPA